MAKPGRKPNAISLDSLGLGGSVEKVTLQNMSIPMARQGDLQPSPKFQQNPDAVAYFMFYKNNVGIGHLAPVDGPMLEKLCTMQSLADQVLDELASTPGFMVTSALGVESTSPHFGMLIKLFDMIRRFSAELSLTPAERGRVSKGPSGAGVEDKVQNLKRHYLGASPKIVEA